MRSKAAFIETAKTQAEIIQEPSRAKSNFLANMSCEMRSPLNAVIGLSELVLNSGEVKGDLEDKFSKIYVAGMTLAGIVNDVLDISKIESGKFELHPVEYDTSSFVNEVVSLNIGRIGERPIRFKLTLDENMPRSLLGDDLRVKQIFNNLLSNAFKHTNSGTVEWKLSYEQEGSNVWLVSTVMDTGIGIRKQDIPRLFHDYSQVDVRANRKTEGTGLGLSITKRLVNMMGGTISAESEYGKGSTFSVRLRQQFVKEAPPIGKEKAEDLAGIRFPAQRRVQSANLSRVDLSYVRVLVIDDMPMNLDVIKGMLLPYNMKVDCAMSGQQAINMIIAENPRYDAVFMDHIMPGMDGIETVRIIREVVGTEYARKIPVIALTANAISGNEDMFLSRGFQAYISKPIDMIHLDSILRQWVRNKKREREQIMKNEFGMYEERAARAGHSMLSPSEISIDGLDISGGLKHFNSSEETYITVLRSYAVNTRLILSDMQKNLKAGNFADYAVSAHGVRGASFGICAIPAGKSAERLKELAYSKKEEQLLIENGSFVKYMYNFLDSIDNILSVFDPKNRKPFLAEPDPEVLRELCEACMEYDIRRVDRAMQQLESFEYESGKELVSWLREQVDDSNFEEIAEETGWVSARI